MRFSSEIKSPGMGRIMRTGLSRLLKDEKSAAVSEYAIIFSLIVCLLGLLFTSSQLRARSAGIIALEIRSEITHVAADKNQSSSVLEKNWRLNDLAKHLAISLESARLLYKDEPDVLRVSALRRKKGAPYCVPDSVARRVYCRHGGLDSHFNDEHYTIRIVSASLGCGRETVRLLVRNEPGVLNIRLGRKKSHRMYSIPRSVQLQLHTRLLNAA